MGLLDQLAGQMLGGSNAGGNSQLVQLALQLLQNNEGGLGGLLQALGKGGLGEQVASWVGTGSNMPVSGDQLSSALGSDVIGALASQFGLDESSAAGGLAQVLPQLINHVTPDGATDGSDDLLQQGLSSILGQLFR